VDDISLAQDKENRRALVNAVTNLRVQYNAGKLWSGYITDGVSSSAQLHRVTVMCLFRKTTLPPGIWPSDLIADHKTTWPAH
jgi:hypothetical protein